ncbi:proline-rich transmembrane protein 1 isoform X1 [Nematostella vectensis]|uniref:proline-rich transmembrane protein 1 isoform X1 n=1 Tax=Nematostella vectensis TaxID=45351 RepID=UPI00138FAEBF|nr:proline-rich transmembrane protein 1 isoform X1 [Nematostella vectensis]
MDKEPPTSTTDVGYSQPPQGYPGVQTYPINNYPPPAYNAQGYPGTPPPAVYSQQPYYGPPTTQQTFVQQQPGVVVVQQPIGVVSPPDYQALAWFACLCCCWPVGIVAIIKSNEVRNAMARGDYAAANAASSSARTLSMVSIGMGVAFMVLYLILLIVWIIPLIVAVNSNY